MPLWRLTGTICLLATSGLAQSETPLSAIDWLSDSVTPVTVAPATLPGELRDEPPVAESALPAPVTVTTLDGPSPDPVGLLPENLTGLPRSLWSTSSEDTLVMLTRAESMPSLPAIQDFLIVLMLAEADPPLGAGPDGALYLARVDKLLEIGALQEAQSLLEQAGGETPSQFRRLFDVALLTGSEDRACKIMGDKPGVAPTLPARVFCMARNGDWTTAALTVNTARVLGDISPAEEALLTAFLDPELFEDGALPAPERPTPLDYRIREAIGEVTPTDNLPLAFAHADLRDTAGWKAQLEAAERLIRAGAIDANVLIDLYTSGTPSASGGVWDRADAMQAFDAAIREKDVDKVADTLPAAWEAMVINKSEVAFAALYADALLELPLGDAASELALTIGLLSEDYERVAIEYSEVPPFLAALARGVPQEVRADTPDARAVQAAFNGTPPPDALADLIKRGKLGEALLRTIALFEAASNGDTPAMTEALATLRAVGLEDVARRASLQFLLLDRRI